MTLRVVAKLKICHFSQKNSVYLVFLFNTDSDEMNDKVMQVSFRFAQALYDTNGADRLAILLDKS